MEPTGSPGIIGNGFSDFGMQDAATVAFATGEGAVDSAVVLGLLAGGVCALAVDLKFKLGYDDSLDIVGIHLVAGVVGTLYLGFFAIDTACSRVVATWTSS